MGLRSFFSVVAVTAAACASSAAWAQVNVYGRIDIGGIPTPPALVFPQPVVIAPPRVVVDRAPIYLHVPPGHSRHWSKHCHRYNACGQPVYFVRDDWYQNSYRPHRHPRHDVRHERRMERHDRHDRRDDRGPGRGNGHGHGHGHGHDKH